MMIRGNKTILIILTLTLITFGVLTVFAGSIENKTSEDKVINIARAKAKKEGINLNKYDLVKCAFNESQKDREWTVFFNGKRPTRPGYHFLVWISKDMKKIELMRGQ